MQLRLPFLLFALFMVSLVTAQDGMIGTGFANGWNYPGDVVSLQPSFGGSYIYTTKAAFNGDNFFRFTRSSDGNQLGPNDCTDRDWSNMQGVSFNNMWVCNTSGAFFINAPNTTDNYVFKTRFQSDDDFLYFRIEGDVFDFIPGQTAQDPMPDAMGKVATDAPVTVLTVASPPVGQGIYLRYTTDGFATSTVVEMTDPLGLLTYEATIPAQADGTTVSYYLFSSGTGSAGPLADGSDADYKTINAETNGGSNFSYTIDAALPVSYRSFTGQRTKQGVALNWATASEENADFFELQRSTDNGRNWQICTRLLAANLATGAEYDYLDQRAPTGQLQYRLRQVDVDGTAAFSQIVRVVGQASINDIAIFPQPAGNQVTIGTELTDYATAQLEILDINGRKLRALPLNESRQSVNTADLARGVYVVRIWENDQLLASRRLVKQ